MKEFMRRRRLLFGLVTIGLLGAKGVNSNLAKSKLTIKQLAGLVPQGWKVIDEKKLQREFKFRDFVEAFGFMAKVAIASEKMDHHPKWLNVYNRVTIDLTTHNVGGISSLDIDLAKKINSLL